MNRTNLINYIIKKQGYKSYLEIGIGTVKHFAFVDCKRKIGVDPDKIAKKIHENMNVAGYIHSVTSDEYFARNKKVIPTQCGDFVGYSDGFDLIFIDGLHHADQVRKDIINAWECLSDGGCLVIHDTNPDREEITHVPRDSKEWCGDVYKAIYQVNNDKFTLKDDHGVTVIRKTGELIIDDAVIDWPEFNEFRNEILNLKTWEECVNLIEGWKVTAT